MKLMFGDRKWEWGFGCVAKVKWEVVLLAVLGKVHMVALLLRDRQGLNVGREGDGLADTKR